MNAELPTPPIESPDLPPTVPANNADWDWLKRLLACNPFYLLSAALLLFGVYRVSVDPAFLATETRQLAFNFTSLQIYECLLVTTAILLARRALWYDSTLLASLEVALLLVPFILVSQAALIEQSWVWGFCAAGLGLACLRVGALRSWFRELHLPPAFLGVGGTILLANAALPVIYRLLHEDKVGTRPNYGAAFYTNEWVWLAGLPLLVALAWLFPTPRERNAQIPGRAWLPDFFNGFLLAGTGVHLWALGYVYDFDVRRELVAPAVWVAAWMLALRLPAYVPDPTSPGRTIAWALPTLMALMPAEGDGNATAVALCGANLLAFGAVAGLGRHVRLSVGLAVVSAVCLIANWPAEHAVGRFAELDGGQRCLGALAVLAVLAALCSRHPAAGFAGALALFFAGGLLPYTNERGHWRAQAFLICLLLHSLRWDDSREAGLGGIRNVLALLWLLASVVFFNATTIGWRLSLIGITVGGIWFVVWAVAKSLPAIAVPTSAVLVVAIAPTAQAWSLAGTAPSGLLATLASLLLFAAGTAFACTRHIWQQAEKVGPPWAAPEASSATANRTQS